MLDLVRSYLARRRIKRMFGSFLSPAEVDRMIESGEEPAVEAADIEITPLYASVHSYVSLAEQLPLTALRELLNSYFDTCVTEIQNEGGTIDRFLGDAIAAMFGAPLRMPDHALHGCVAALKCQARVADLRERLGREGDRWPECVRHFRVRFGLHTGIAMVGNQGAKGRANYTMMGDNVNLAARMEAGAKNWGVWVLCTEATRRGCENAEPGRIFFRPLGKIIVKGRADLLELFEPIALRENVTDQQRECVATFEAGLAKWRERDWPGAIEVFERSARLEPQQIDPAAGIVSNPSTVFLGMAREMRGNPGAAPVVF